MKKKPGLLRPFVNTFNYFIGAVIITLALIFYSTIWPFSLSQFGHHFVLLPAISCFNTKFKRKAMLKVCK